MLLRPLFSGICGEFDGPLGISGRERLLAGDPGTGFLPVFFRRSGDGVGSGGGCVCECNGEPAEIVVKTKSPPSSPDVDIVRANGEYERDVALVDMSYRSEEDDCGSGWPDIRERSVSRRLMARSS